LSFIGLNASFLVEVLRADGDYGLES